MRKGKIPILVGGTGFYIQAVTRDIDFTQAEQETAYREELEHLAKEKGAEYLHENTARSRSRKRREHSRK